MRETGYLHSGEEAPGRDYNQGISTTSELRMQLTTLHRKQFYVTEFLKSSHN
jgi:hypothetical protein